MNPHIYEFTPFSVIGYPQRQRKSNVKRTADIPAYWDSLKMDSAALLTKLHDTFTASKHFEISMCYDIDTENGEFTYLLGRGIDNPADYEKMEPDMTRVDIQGGLYAVFSTQLFPKAIYETSRPYAFCIKKDDHKEYCRMW